MRVVFNLFLLITSSFCLISQVEAQEQTGTDTLLTEPKLLDEITVVGYDDNRRLLETAGTVGLVDRQVIKAYDETSVVPAMNTIPGVKMEQRSPGSYRIAIRGSTLRTPFGVRNVKVYWNDIPFTEPSGSTDFNLLDVINMGSIEVIKGPAGSIYGAGTGGVVNIQSEPEEETLNRVGFAFGSYGMKRIEASLNKINEQNSLSFKYAHQEAEGYREHTALDRDVLHLRGKFAFSQKSTVRANLLYSDLYYEIPGGLTQEQYTQNPRQARPGNQFAQGSIETNASISQKYLLFGLSQDYQWNESFSNQTVLYGDLSFFENPFLFDYKRDSQSGGGGRTRFQYDIPIGNIDASIMAGVEYQTALNVSRNFGNQAGQPDTLNFDDELRSWQALYFAKANMSLPNNFFLTLGLSHNQLNYDIYRLVDVALDSTYRVEKSFDPVWTPRIGLVKQWGQTAAHASISYGFSPPAIEDVRTNEGSINLNLKPERGINYEIGFRGNTFQNKLNFDITAFYFKLNETIVQEQSDRGTVLFVNAGNTDQRGFEAALTWFAITAAQGFLSDLEMRTAYTLHDFKFKNYVNGGEDLSGNALTGVAPHTWVTTALFTTRPGVYLNITFNFTDQIPLNDANTVYADAYHLLLAKAGYRKALNDRLQLEIFAGADNLFNEKYSLGNDLNASGGRYFQPAPGRNYYGGAKLLF